MIEKKNKKSFFIIFFSNLFIFTAGYPYFIVYSLFLFIPYIIFIPFLFNGYSFAKFNYEIFNFYILTLFSFLSSYLITLPWLLKVKNLMKSLVDRTENNWNFATEHTFYWKDTIGSWIFPPASSTEGWYYSGIIVSLIIFLGLLIILFDSKKINYFDKKIFISSIIFIFFITYFSWGKHSALFIWSWENIPLLGSLRTWPRINIIIIPFIILLFSISLKYLTIYLKKNNRADLNRIIKFLILIFILFAVLQFIFYFFNFQNEEYWNFWQKKRFDAAINFLPSVPGDILRLYDGPIYLLFNIISAAFLIFVLCNKKIRDNLNLIYTITLLIVVSELFVISNLQWSLPEWKTKFHKIDNPLDSNRGYLRTTLKHSLIENLLYNEKRQHDSLKLFEISIYSIACGQARHRAIIVSLGQRM